jgi:FtsH-binding integral membrane protein
MLPVYDNDCDTSTPLIHLETKIKNKFILKIYCILSLQLFITFLMSLGCYFTNSARQFVLQQQGVLISTILLSFLFLILSLCYGRNYPCNYVCLFGFTLSESYLVTYICLFYQPITILLACGLTLSIFIILSVYVYYTKSDFQFIGAGLFASLWILIIGEIIQVIWLPRDQLFNTFMAIFGSIIACGYILYDTSEILNRLTPDDFIHACISLYTDIIMLFLRLLELLGDD